MTYLNLTAHEPFVFALGAAAWLAVGALLGACHFLTLRWVVRMLASGRKLAMVLGVQLLRLAGVAGALGLVASQFGALPLLAAAGGILATRTAILRLGVRP